MFWKSPSVRLTMIIGVPALLIGLATSYLVSPVKASALEELVYLRGTHAISVLCDKPSGNLVYYNIHAIAVVYRPDICRK